MPCDAADGCAGIRENGVCQCVSDAKGSSPTQEAVGGTSASSATTDTTPSVATVHTVLGAVGRRLNATDKRLDEVMLALSGCMALFEKMEDLPGSAWIRRVRLVEEDNDRLRASLRKLRQRVTDLDYALDDDDPDDIQV